MNWKIIFGIVLVVCLVSERATCKPMVPKVEIGNPTKGDPSRQDSAVKDPQRLWPQAEIPYIISPEFEDSEKDEILRAMNEFHSKACLRFVPKNDSHQDYIYIQKGKWCYSHVGKNGGFQFVYLNDICLASFGSILHELMHVAGFDHEHSRYDRDDFVTIKYENIIPTHEYNFVKKSQANTTSLGLPYDYASLTHYIHYAGSKNNLHTIVTKEDGVNIGQRGGLSKLDIAGLNLLYKCVEVKRDCKDDRYMCPKWAQQGYCNSYFFSYYATNIFMSTSCKMSCNLCYYITEGVLHLPSLL